MDKAEQIMYDITTEQIENIFNEFFYKEGIDPKLTIEQLKSKILPGYTYRITGKLTLATGSGGILLYIDGCKGLMPGIIQNSIEVFHNGKFIKLSNLKVNG